MIGSPPISSAARLWPRSAMTLAFTINARPVTARVTAYRPGNSCEPTASRARRSLVRFVAYLHGVVRLMRVHYLLETIADESRHAVEENFPPARAYVEAQPPPSSLSPQLLRYAGTTGVLTAIDLFSLVQLCRDKGCWVELTVCTGEYLDHGTHFASVHGGELDYRDIACLFLVRGERTFVQDPNFGFRQLADVAVRALSPAVNDPTTAVQATARISDLLGLVGTRPEPTGWLVDSANVVRAKQKWRDFAQLLTLSLTEIIRYGADAPQVVRRLLACSTSSSRPSRPNAGLWWRGPAACWTPPSVPHCPWRSQELPPCRTGKAWGRPRRYRP